MVGKNVKLYDMVLQFLRTLFLRTRNVHYCTLRAELLMSLHDLDVSDICTVDPCHKVVVPASLCTSPAPFSSALTNLGVAADHVRLSLLLSLPALCSSARLGVDEQVLQTHGCPPGASLAVPLAFAL